MKQKRLSLSQLRAIEAVASRRNFSDAAGLLGVSQPSISNHVTAVESRFGVQLFERRGHQAVQSQELERLLPKLRTILTLVDELEGEMEGRRALETGHLRVGYSTYQIAVPILTRFMRRFPNVQVEARSMASSDLASRLESGDLDVACITAREIPAHLSGIWLRDMKIVLAVPVSHPFAEKGRVSFKDLVGQPLIQREVTSNTRKLLEARAALARAPLTTILAVGSWGSIVEMIRAGVGLGVGLDVEVENVPGITRVEVDDKALKASQFLVHLPERRVVSAVQAFLSTATELAPK
ncbi:LysR family transcriptional regulator [Shimia sp. CNT1-13L.2]|uniref:LysR family transcriptional regulator n=1 Tax=Shimia sp. CNT1-13L.2 TaxID=2959663 RepID=UPI0020CF783D|nr:LysR family transcriptional regulator [Shimia sp. CNT1-13L.2]